MATESLTFSIGADTAAFRNQMAAAAKSLAGLTAAFIGFRSVSESFSNALDMGGRLNDLSARTGETAGNLALLERAFSNAGSSADKVGPSINKMQKTIQDAAEGGKEAVDALSALGLTAEELGQKTPLEQMQILASRISSIPDPTQRAAAAMGVFGKSGGELLPVLRNFAGEIELAKHQMGDLPEILNRSVGSFDNFGDALTSVKNKNTEFAVGLLSEVIPAIEEAFGKFSELNAAGAGAHFGKGLVALATHFGDTMEAVGLKMWGRFKDMGNEIIAWTNYTIGLVENFFKLASSSLVPNIVDILYGGLMRTGAEFNKLLIGAALDVINALSGVFPALQKGVQPLIDANAQSIYAAERGRSKMAEGAKAISDAFKLAQDITPVIRNDVLGAYETYQRAEEAAKRALESGQSDVQKAVSQDILDAVLAGLDPVGSAFSKMARSTEVSSNQIDAATSAIPQSYSGGQNRIVATVGEQERKRTARGASYEGAYKRGENSSGEVMNRSVSLYGTWEDGTPKTPEEFKTGKRESAEKADAAKKGEMAKSGGKGRGQEQSPALQVLNQIAGVLARLEPKVPQHIMA